MPQPHPTFAPAAATNGVARPRTGSADPIQSVDDAVQSVLGNLGSARAATHHAELVFPERLVLLRHAEALPTATRELKIAAGTVVTPLAQQSLKQRGIVIRFVSRSESQHAKTRGEWGFVIESASGTTSAVRRALLDATDAWSEIDGFESLMRWLTQTTDRGALLLTDEASVAVWRACQVPDVRAAVAESCEAVELAIRALGLNLLVVEPSGKSIALIRQLGLTLRRAGAPRAPEGPAGGTR